jgi:hypothetical protein
VFCAAQYEIDLSRAKPQPVQRWDSDDAEVEELGDEGDNGDDDDDDT